VAIRKTEALTSSGPVTVYVDAEVTFAPTNKQAQINAAGASRLLIPAQSRKAIKIGDTASALSLSEVIIDNISLWGDSGTRITQGRMNVYGIYIALASDQLLMEQYLQNKGLAIY